MSEQRRQFTVIGAGMVGVCCGLCLQNEGFSVEIVDKGGPGEGASSGNLGNFGIASCPPFATPGILKQVPGMLVNSDSPLRIRWRFLPSLLPWFVAMARASNAERVEEIASARQSLLDKVHDALDPIIAEAGAAELIGRTGLLFTFESEKAYQSSHYAFDLRARNGVKQELLDGHEARQLEPSLSKDVVRAWFIPELAHTVDPEALVKSLAELFRRKGGSIARRKATGFEAGSAGVERLLTDQGPLEVRNVVVAAGAFSRTLAKSLGTGLPLAAERGYHTVFLDAQMKMRVPVISVDRKLAVTPMRRGIRAGGFAEFAAPAAPPDMRLAKMARRNAEELFPELRSDAHSEWMGARPSFPDSIPVIGRSPKHKNAWFAFGHDHLGLTMGAITGRMISEMAAGKTPSVDPAPFSPERFA